MKRERGEGEAVEEGGDVQDASPAKRARGADGEAAAAGGGNASNGQHAEAEAPAPRDKEQQDDEENEDERAVVLPRSTTRSAVKKGAECPYLDTVCRQVRSLLRFVARGGASVTRAAPRGAAACGGGSVAAPSPHHVAAPSPQPNEKRRSTLTLKSAAA